MEALTNCPVCGTPYAGAEDGSGCPVCLLRRALKPNLAEETGASVDEPTPDDGRFNHYQLVRRTDEAFDELGRGAMGVTYRAVDTVLRHAVALKVIDPRIAVQPEARQRFLREARAAARLRHPNVASVFYYGVRERDGQCFYAMELVEGETLESRLRRAGPLPPSLALEVIVQVAKALIAAEAHGLVHRDLKPANLMLVEEPELTVKVIDFGLAKAASTDGSETKLTYGGFVGTPAFASPEQFTGTSVDIRSDLYSAGVVLWDMVAGKAPFLGNPGEVMYQHQHAPLPFGQLEGVPQAIVVLLKVLLEKDPGRRFQSPTELLKAMPTVTDAIDSERTITHQSLLKMLNANPYTVARRPPPKWGPQNISVSRLPVTGRDVFGREEDIAFLNEAWSNQHVNVVTIVAWAGVGKSTLINHWLRHMAAEHYCSAELVFGWSFYKQGSSGDTSSADDFLHAALAWFGDSDPRIGTPWEKGERLAHLIAQRRALVVLDGLEPLQNPPGPQEGRVREPSLQAFLRELAAYNRGLCVITTRLPIADIANHERTSALRHDLEQLSSDAGAKLLRALGVKGPETELRNASDEFSGHCLALTLLGSYLTDAYNGDIGCHAEVSKRLAQDVRQGVHARKVLESYQTWFGEGPELSVLRMLGLFDRPADEKAIGFLLKLPEIPRLTETLTHLGPSEWRMVIAKLRRARLLAGEDPDNRGHLDAHPLVREYFGEQLRNERKEAWKECNRRLYIYYKELAPLMPDSFMEMEPLLLAVICGCNTGLFHEALHEVYIPRIQRGNESFAANVLGARGPLLLVLAHFFEYGRWGSPVESGVEGQSLTAEDQLFILMQAALYLTAIRGFAVPEARTCYERAKSLCHLLKRPVLLYSALMGQWRYSLGTDKLSVTMRIAKRVYSLAHEQNDPALMLGAYRSLAATLYLGGDFETAGQNARHGVQIWRSGAVELQIEEIIAPAVACLCYEALSEWHSGKVTSCHATMQKALSLAKDLHDTQALVLALFWSATLAHFEGNPAEVERLASEVIEISLRQNFALWLPVGVVLRGWARCASGNSAEGISWIDEGINDYRVTGSILTIPFSLTLKAEALHLSDRTSEALDAIDEAEALVERFQGRVWSAELYRLRGVFLTAIGGDESKIQASFHSAIRTAREQKSALLAKRAKASYAQYRSQKMNASGEAGFRLPLW
jgi:serine/threonine protein kinase